MKKRTLILISSIVALVLILCVIVVILLINNKKPNEEPTASVEVKTEFKDLFNEKQEEYEIIRLGYDINHQQNGKCSIIAKIPLLIGETANVKAINQDINNIFANKMYEIALDAEVYTIYNIDYVASEKDGIVSLMIKCVLKSGSNPQRTIIKTYNYNSNTDKMVTIDGILLEKGLTKEEVQTQVLTQAQQENDKNEIINEQGYNVYMRDLDSEIYNTENMTEFYINQNNNLYVIYAYGNQNSTSELDVVTF